MDAANMNELGIQNGEVEDAQQQKMMRRKDDEEQQTPLMALNHVSRLCQSVDKSKDFYKGVLGVVEMERPHSLDFKGAWLFNYGLGIHIVQARDEDRLPPVDDTGRLDPMDNHISFQCEDMEELLKKLKDRKIKDMKRTLGEDVEAKIDQLFFNEPDGFMIEICNCENIKLVPQGSLGKIKLPPDQHSPPVELNGSADSIPKFL